MTTASDLTWRVTEIATCPICLEDCKNAKSLPCLHSFCLNCLEEHYKDQLITDEVTCPVCRQGFQIPPDGLQGLPHNFFVQKLIDARDGHASSQKSEEVMCEVCLLENEDGDIQTASMYCVGCIDNLCERCSRSCCKEAKGKPHEVKPLEDQVSVELTQKCGIYCDQHQNKRLKLYCYDCTMNMCLMCFAADHTGHKSGSIEKVAEEFTQQFNSFAETVASRVDEFRAAVQQVADQSSKFQSAVTQSEAIVQHKGEAMHHITEDHVTQLLDKLQTEKSSGVKEASNRSEEMKLALTSLESFQVYLEKLTSKGSPCDITGSGKAMLKRANELLETYATPRDYQAPQVSFTPTNVVELTEGHNFIGHVEFQTSGSDSQVGSELRCQKVREREREREHQLEDELRQLQGDMKEAQETIQTLRSELEKADDTEEELRREMQQCAEKQKPLNSHYCALRAVKSDGVKGVTTLDDKLYVLRRPQTFNSRDSDPFWSKPTASGWSKPTVSPWSRPTGRDSVYETVVAVNIDVYLKADFSQLPGITLPKLDTSKDIASCERNKCLYILGGKGSIYKLALNGPLTKLFSSRSVRAFSVTPGGNVLAVCDKSLQEISSDSGQSLRVIQLDTIHGSPVHAVLMDTGHFVVCFTQGHRVRIIDEDGSVAHTHGTEDGSGIAQLDSPRYLAVNKDSQFIVAADDHDDNYRVVLLSPTLEFIRCVIDKLPHTPIRVHFDHVTQRLYVAQHNGVITVLQL